jgi:hypothetical protein
VKKDSSQETIISLLGMLAGSLVVSRISSKLATWTAMLFLLAIHLGTNYLAVRAVCMRTLNRQRANLAFSTALDHVQKHSDGNLWRGLIALDRLPGPTPNDIRRRERVFEEDGVLRWDGEILGYCKVGVSLKTLLACFSDRNEVTGSYTETPDFGRLLTIFNDVPYIIWYDEPRKMFLVVLGKDSSSESELCAWLFSLYYAKYGREVDETMLDSLKRTLEKIRGIDRGILGHLEKIGWDVKTAALETQSGTRIKRPAHPQGFRY